MNSKFTEIKRASLDALSDKDVMEILGDEKCKNAILMACNLEKKIDENDSSDWIAEFESFDAIIGDFYLALSRFGLEEMLGEASWRLQEFGNKYA